MVQKKLNKLLHSIIFIVSGNLHVTPVNPVVVENSSVVLSCDCGCSIQPYWFKNNQSIHNYDPGSHYTFLANGSLHINVSRYTAGNYSCEIRNSSFGLRSKEVRLEVWCKYTYTQQIWMCFLVNRFFPIFPQSYIAIARFNL